MSLLFDKYLIDIDSKADYNFGWNLHLTWFAVIISTVILFIIVVFIEISSIFEKRG